MSTAPVITFTSDFGTREYYVGAVRGAVLSVNPEARMVDISHDIGSHDLVEGAFTLMGAYSFFPPRTIHLIVVDPGVGSNRRGLVVSTEKHLFVAPDNGVLSLVYAREQVNRVHSIEAEHYFRQPVAPTFHGRDIFGPVAGWLSKGIEPDKFGPQVEDFIRLNLPPLQPVAEGVVEGVILHIDKFGNIITSLNPIELKDSFDAKPASLILGDHEVAREVQYYSEGTGEEVFFLRGSSGYYEIAALKQSAARKLGARRGMKVRARLVEV